MFVGREKHVWNGDVIFRAGEKKMLLLGLHPEWQNLAVRNSVFRRGTRKWNYQWVPTEFPAPNHVGVEYSFHFTSTTGFKLDCGDRVSII